MDNPNQKETNNENILRILNLESLEGLTYGDYYELLLEQLALISINQSDLSTEDAMLLQEEIKKVKLKAKRTPKQKIKVVTRRISKNKLFNRSPQQRGGALVKSSTLKIPKRKTGIEDVEKDLNLESKENTIILTSILDSLTRISNILTSQVAFDRSVYERNRKEKEQEKRKSKENSLESSFSKGINSLVQISKSVFSPFQDIIKKLLNFFTWVFLGASFQKFMKWASNPENEGKVKILTGLIKTFWPALLGAIVLFTTPFGRFVRILASTIIGWTVKLSKFAIPKLIAFIAKNPVASIAAAGLGTGLLANEVTGQRKSAEVQADNKAKAQSGKGLGLSGTDTPIDKSPSVGDMGRTTPFGLLQGVSNGGFIRNIFDNSVNHGYNGIDENTGEDIQGAGRDTQLIAARPGEVVLTPEDQSYIFQRTGFDIPKFVGGRKPKYINGSNIKFADANLGSGLNKIPKFESGGIVGGGTKTFGEAPLIQQALKAGIKGNELAAFLAQMSHETGGFKWSRELGRGRGMGYSGGSKFHGRGYTQLTHDYNYKHFGNKLGVDLIKDPDLIIKNPSLGAQVAVEYWKERVRPRVKDWNDVFSHSAAINRPSASDASQINGYQDRVNKFNYYKKNLQQIVTKSTPKPQVKPKNNFNLGRSAQASEMPKTKTNQQRLIEKRPWWDKFGWFGGASRWNKKKGGGLIEESTGIDVPHISDDRQMIFGMGKKGIKPYFVHPGEYVLPADTVMRLGGKGAIDKLVEKTDSNSTAATDGKILNPIENKYAGIKPYNMNADSSLISKMSTSGAMPGSMSGGSGTSSDKTNVPQEFHSPICHFAAENRELIFQVLGIVA